MEEIKYSYAAYTPDGETQITDNYNSRNILDASQHILEELTNREWDEDFIILVDHNDSPAYVYSRVDGQWLDLGWCTRSGIGFLPITLAEVEAGILGQGSCDELIWKTRI